MNVDHAGSGGLAAGCVLRKEKRKCMTTHRCTLAAEPADSQHPGQKRGPLEACGGRGWHRGMCDAHVGPRARGWRRESSSLNENIQSEMESTCRKSKMLPPSWGKKTRSVVDRADLVLRPEFTPGLCPRDTWELSNHPLPPLSTACVALTC